MTTANMLEPDWLLAEARQRAGLENFGEDTAFLEPMRTLARSVDQQANLHDNGRSAASERIVSLLVDRLRTEDWIRRHPEILEEDIAAPIVIAALPRTGTTMLHRFIASDPRMYAVLWYECRYPVPFPGDGEPSDPRIAQAEREVKMMLETYPGLDAIHPMDPVGPDEDIMLLEHAFLSGMPQSMYDVPDYVALERRVSHESAYRYLKLLLQFLQWQKKQAGQSRERWVLKAPEHLVHIDVLMKVFPDATVVQSHRDPMQTIPSISSMILSSWAAFTDSPDPHEIGRQWCERMAAAMRGCNAARERYPDRFVDIWYQDTVSDPFAVAETVYRGVGLKISGAARGEMTRWREENRREQRAAHEYALEQFGFTEAQIAKDFAEYRERYILPRERAAR